MCVQYPVPSLYAHWLSRIPITDDDHPYVYKCIYYIYIYIYIRYYNLPESSINSGFEHCSY